MTLEPHTFNSNETLTLAIAAYAALVSTFVLGWVAYKWLAPRATATYYGSVHRARRSRDARACKVAGDKKAAAPGADSEQDAA
jgi:hypothetical protein